MQVPDADQGERGLRCCEVGVGPLRRRYTHHAPQPSHSEADGCEVLGSVEEEAAALLHEGRADGCSHLHLLRHQRLLRVL